jgi:hypothetical protein
LDAEIDNKAKGGRLKRGREITDGPVDILKVDVQVKKKGGFQKKIAEEVLSIGEKQRSSLFFNIYTYMFLNHIYSNSCLAVLGSLIVTWVIG